MIKKVGEIEFKNGTISKFYSDIVGCSFYVVEYNNWGYINIFDENKEELAITSLFAMDVSNQDRDGNLPYTLQTEEGEAYFNEYLDILELYNFEYAAAEEKYFHEFPMDW